MQPIVISAVSRKGGAGKTTLVRALASALTYNGKKVLLIDFDPNRALAEWVERAVENKISSPLLCIAETTKTQELVDTIDQAFVENSHDYILVDTPGIGGGWADTIAMQSDLIVTPIILARTDFQRGLETISWYDRLHERASDKSLLPGHATIITRLSTKARNGVEYLPKTQELFFNELKKRGRPVAFALRERQAYQDMDNEGLLGPKAEQLRADKNPLVRAHANHIEAALHEAVVVTNALLKRLGETPTPINAADWMEA